MESFRTLLLPAPAAFDIFHRNALLLAGSCFTEHIGARLAERKFDALVNPFGIVYNPASIADCLERLLAGNRPFESAELFENQGLWHSWAHHGHFSKPNREQTLEGIQTAYHHAAVFLRRTKYLLITLGTADVFRLRSNGRIVANNHKMPGHLFESQRLSVTEITERLGAVLNQIRVLVPDIQVIVSVSPLRHLRAGAVENQRSKAALVLACEALCRDLPYVTYFPAYEILLDDLRDYRFYAADMIHPSEVAIDYIWQFFSEMFFSKDTKALNERIEKVLAGVRHRAFNPDTEAHRAFVRGQLAAMEGLEKEKGLDFGAERGLLGGFDKG